MAGVVRRMTNARRVYVFGKGKEVECPRCGTAFSNVPGTPGRPRKFCSTECGDKFYERKGKTTEGSKRKREAPPSSVGWNGPVGARPTIAQLWGYAGEYGRGMRPAKPVASNEGAEDEADAFMVMLGGMQYDNYRAKNEEAAPLVDGWEVGGRNPDEGQTCPGVGRVIGSDRPWNEVA